MSLLKNYNCEFIFYYYYYELIKKNVNSNNCACLQFKCYFYLKLENFEIMTRIQTSSGPMMVSRMIFDDTTAFELKNDCNINLSSSKKLPDCWLCCERTIDCVLLDCGHLISCLSCAQQKIRRFGNCMYVEGKLNLNLF